MTELEIKEDPIQNNNSMNIPYLLLFQITCLKILASRKIHLVFFTFYQ